MNSLVNDGISGNLLKNWPKSGIFWFYRRFICLSWKIVRIWLKKQAKAMRDRWDDEFHEISLKNPSKWLEFWKYYGKLDFCRFTNIFLHFGFWKLCDFSRFRWKIVQNRLKCSISRWKSMKIATFRCETGIRRFLRSSSPPTVAPWAISSPKHFHSPSQHHHRLRTQLWVNFYGNSWKSSFKKKPKFLSDFSRISISLPLKNFP